jgi:hypothetical protein
MAGPLKTITAGLHFFLPDAPSDSWYSLRRSAALCVALREIRMSVTSESPSPPPARWYQPRIWHLSLLVVFVAIAIADIQDQRMHEPVLIALAAGGFAAYGLIGWLGWSAARRRFGARIRPIWLFVLYALAMGVFFLVATAIYLLIEYRYRTGHF